MLMVHESPISSAQLGAKKSSEARSESRSSMGGASYPAKAGLAHIGLGLLVHGCLLDFPSNYSKVPRMRAVIQRVSESTVKVEGKVVGSIGKGLLALIAAGPDDDDKDVALLVNKIVNLRIFHDDEGKMNLSLLDIDGEILGISQFTLYGDARKGRRPSFIGAMEPLGANALYEKVLAGLRDAGVSKVAKGEFGAEMQVSIVNEGPVTILLDSKKLF